MKLEKRILVVLTLLLTTVGLTAQEEPVFEEQVDVNVVLVDVTVTDDRGNQILGLRKDDFVILEDGQEQEITSIDYFTNRRLLTGPETQAAFQVERIKEERYFVLFFHKIDDSTTMPGLRQQLLRAKKAAEEFVDNEMLPEDRVAVTGYDARLKIFTDFTTDKSEVRAALDQVIRFSNGELEASNEEGEASILANLNSTRIMKKTGRLETALETLAEGLEPIEARKVLVFFSPGVIDDDFGSSRIQKYDEHRFKAVVQGFNEANVSVYSLNLLQDVFYSDTEDFLARLADETGGEYYRAAVTYQTPLQLIENQNNGYYMLSYYSRKQKEEHGYQEIDVTLKNPQFQIKSREGYKY